jgi:hypothetical protein
VVGGVWKKVTKKKGRLRAKKRSPNIPASRAPKLISPYALGGRKIHKFALGAEMASHGPDPTNSVKSDTQTII